MCWKVLRVNTEEVLIVTLRSDPKHKRPRNYYCTCTPKQITAYNNWLSGPIQDCMDILLKLDTVVLDGEEAQHNETLAAIRTRFAAARRKQYE